MTTTRRFTADDMFRFNNINLDPLTETVVYLSFSLNFQYNLQFYFEYLAIWPEYFLTVESPDDKLMGYIMGKVEGVGEDWHGHVTAVTVSPDFRRLYLAQYLMHLLEEISEKIHNGYFVDLFVRVSNNIAVDMYKKFGYSVYRRVLGYYSGEEDAYDMRKALPRDVHKKSIIPLGRPVRPEELM